MDSILKRTNPDEYTLKKLNDTFYSAVYYIANTEMSVSELWAYVGEMKAKLDAVVPDAVSYTHLDVYKRQNRYRVLRGQG